ncbi:MAG TPA: NAD(+) kinase, partial [Prevotella sp.]|nr:NAD(+) kinase [Prevotella sp.]
MKKSASIRQVLSCLEKRGAEIYIDKSFCDLPSLGLGREVHAGGVLSGCHFDVGYALPLCGLRSLPRAAAKLGAQGLPILAVTL